MLLPRPMPDEVGLGHLGRIRYLNDLDASQESANALKHHLKSLSPRGGDNPLLCLLATAFHLDPRAYARQHALLPIVRVACKPGQQITAHGDPQHAAVIRRSGMSVPGVGAYFCINYIEEDRAFWGFCYWRRSHQIPGIGWCTKHGSALYEVRTPTAFDIPPDHWVDSTQAILNSAAVAESKHAVIGRYAQIVAAFLDQIAPISGHKASVKLRAQAKRLGLRIDMRGDRPNLSGLIRDKLPASWLKVHFPGLLEKRAGEHFAPIDKICFSSTPATGLAYGVALACIFEASDEALAHFYDASDREVVPRKCVQYGKQFWASDQIRAMYDRHGGSHSKIAAELGIRRTTVTESLKHASLPSLGKLKNEVRLAALEFLSGASLDAACKKHNVELAALERLLRAGAAHLDGALSGELRDGVMGKNGCAVSSVP